MRLRSCSGCRARPASPGRASPPRAAPESCPGPARGRASFWRTIIGGWTLLHAPSRSGRARRASSSRPAAGACAACGRATTAARWRAFLGSYEAARSRGSRREGGVGRAGMQQRVDRAAGAEPRQARDVVGRAAEAGPAQQMRRLADRERGRNRGRARSASRASRAGGSRLADRSTCRVLAGTMILERAERRPSSRARSAG